MIPVTDGDSDKGFASVEHLSLEAVAAFVDGELSAAATHRARVHLVHCGECRGEVAAQRRAAEALRDRSQTITAPQSLVSKLASIATSCPAGPEATVDMCQKPATFLDRIDLFFHAVRRSR